MKVTEKAELVERALRVKNIRDLGAMSKRPAVMLSASVPYERQIPEGMAPAEATKRRARERQFIETMHPQRIRSAVVEFARALLLRGGRLVFGAHPAISPMVLVAARDVAAPSDSVLIFQSGFHRRVIPQSTLDLADGKAGRLVLTPLVAKPTEADTRNASLRKMRSIMAGTPGLRGAVFIGGMDGVLEESEHTHLFDAQLRCYAIASTGAAAKHLFETDPERHSGTLTNPRVLSQPYSYAALAHLILDDMGFPPAQSAVER